MGSEIDVDQCEDFTGMLFMIKRVPFRRTLYHLYLQNEKKQIRVICEGDGYNTGQKLKVRHIGEKAIDIQPLYQRQ